MKVYYVTAVTRLDTLDWARSGNDPNSKPVRHDLAKFFERKPAEEHAKQFHMSSGWTNVRIDECDEPESAQHEAHRAKPKA